MKRKEQLAKEYLESLRNGVPVHPHEEFASCEVEGAFMAGLEKGLQLAAKQLDWNHPKYLGLPMAKAVIELRGDILYLGDEEVE